MKAILVIDMPEHCGECSYCNNNKICLLNLFSKKEKPCDVENAVSVHSSPSWCPLKPIHALKSAGHDYIIYERQYLYKNLEREYELMKEAREYESNNCYRC